ncbi:hypothetical protein DOTSEDRAFT_70598 [Dothistroma septosporum NZE10]|uniref:Phosphoglycerate mutase-like protein n=1 Tax=Dothistroma septosporum (strain NZE10 / CBS 128990) TaxID=675120 RepID=N1PTE1_DOTSN|nr:hypothetical protein DOTSEDRAFT_70598 [Dothistroma septosporum NZE10]
MVKPRLIILIRHAQSEGNKNREIHQMIPDHRVKLTEEGHKQALDAGRRLRALLRPDDKLQIFTSPYRRTRETTEGILKTLTSRDDDEAPSPFSRNKITVYEEPRLREQDFGNFQPCSAEMERMWSERADYGHFFYRIPDGESAADAYDRVSGFNESLWRQFGDMDFPSVCVLVTHGLMSRVFLMKWYHWSVEYFEDLRNVNHCEFVVMRKDAETQKYILENKLRTWSELRRQRKEQQARQDPQRRNTLSSFLTQSQQSPQIPPRKWGGCSDGCNHANDQYPRRTAQRKQQVQQELQLPPAAEAPEGIPSGVQDHPVARVELTAKRGEDLASVDGPSDEGSTTISRPGFKVPFRPAADTYLNPGRDGGGTTSGTTTPHEMSEIDGGQYFSHQTQKETALSSALRKAPQRKATPEDIERWAQESGMGKGQKADALGDEPEAWSDENRGSLDGSNASQGMNDLDRAEKEDKGLRGSVY